MKAQQCFENCCSDAAPSNTNVVIQLQRMRNAWTEQMKQFFRNMQKKKTKDETWIHSKVEAVVS